MESDFDQATKSAKDFARADAERLTLRARLRARAITSVVPDNKNMYIESGNIHF